MPHIFRVIFCIFRPQNYCYNWPYNMATRFGHLIVQSCVITKNFFLIYLTKMPFTVKLNYGKTEISIQNWWWLFSLNIFFIYCNLFIYYLFIY
jgi:hypothetical protein